MSTELLNYCLEQLRTRPRALNISTPLSPATVTYFNRAWLHARFVAQQQAVLTLSPDDPLYGKGYLWHYQLCWRNAPGDRTPPHLLLRIEFSQCASASPRELILLAAVSEFPIAFHNKEGKPIPHSTFKTTKNRMLGKERDRPSGAVAPGLRPLVANVQYARQDGSAYCTAINPASIVEIEYDTETIDNPR